MHFKAVYGRAIRQAQPIHLEKRASLNNIFQKNLKFGRVIPARQDKWTGSDTKKILAGIPTRSLSLIYCLLNN